MFDKVPWPKPTILHKARRARFGRTYDDLLARLRLKQAFGRLIRSETDKGVFVILDAACPSRLLAALPPEAPVLRIGLAEAVAEVRNFLGMNALTPPPAAARFAFSRNPCAECESWPELPFDEPALRRRPRRRPKSKAMAGTRPASCRATC